MTSYIKPLIRHQRRTFLLCKDSGMQKCARMLMKTGKAFVDSSAMTTQIREDSNLWSLPPLTIWCWQNTFGHYKASRRWTWHSPNGQRHNQIDYILVGKRFRSGVNIARTRSFPGVDIGSDNDLMDDDLPPSSEKNQQTKYIRLNFDLEKLKKPSVLRNLPTYDRWEVCTYHHHE